MADFELAVEVRATGLDDIQSKLNALQKSGKTINIEANTKDVITRLDEIQRRLSQISNTKVNFNFSGGSIDNQIKQIGNLGNSYAHLMELAKKMGSFEVKIETLDVSKDSKRIDEIIRQYVEVSKEYNTLRAELSKSIEPAGFKQIDDILNDTANKIKEVKSQMEDISRIKDADIAFSKMLSIVQTMNNYKFHMVGIEDTTADFANLENKLKELKNQYDELMSKFGSSLSSGQINRLNETIASGIVRNENYEARLADKEISNLVKKIEEANIKIKQFNTTANAEQLKVWQSHLQELRQEYEQLINDLANPNVDATNAYGKILDDMKFKLEEADAVAKDKLNKNISDIQLKINTGDIERQIASVSLGYEKLANTGHSSLAQINSDIQQLKVLQEQMNNASSTEQLNAAYQQYSKTLARVKNEIRTVSAESKMMASSLEIKSLDTKIQEWAEKNGRAMKQYGANIEELRNKLASLAQNGGTESELKAIANGFKNIDLSAKQAGLTGSTLGRIFKQTLQTVARYFSVTTLVYKGIAAVKQMANNVMEIDASMTKLYYVTDMTASQYDNLFSKMSESAKQYGASLTEIIDLTTSWIKLGFDPNTSQELANITTMYQHVSGLDTDTAVKNLITTYNGFRDQLDSLYAGDTSKAVEYVADIFYKLNNEFAISAAQLGEGLTNSASALEVSGNTLQQTSAMITGIVEVTQNASKAGKVVARTYGNVWRVIAELW